MAENEFKLSGKLKTLVDAYEKENPGSGKDLTACFNLLNGSKWNPMLASIQKKMAFSSVMTGLAWNEYTFLLDLIDRKVEEMEVEDLTDDEKIDRLFEMLDGRSKMFKIGELKGLAFRVKKGLEFDL